MVNVQSPVSAPVSDYKPVGKKNPARALAEMEIIEREKYWKKVMEDKEASEARARASENVITVEN